MQLFHSPRYTADIGKHVMPMRKFDLVRDELERQGLAVAIREPEPATDEELLRVHTPEYVAAVATGEPRALAESQKFPWSPLLALAVRYTNGGTIHALSAALDHGVAGNIASGFHHAHADHGEGFCTFNGLAVAYEHARHLGRIARCLVVDLDLHYGNGTASLCAARPGFFNLSVYGNYYKENRAHRDVELERAPDTENAWSVTVPNGANGAQYLDIVERALGPSFERARPDVVLYQAGADPYREDPYSPLDVGLEDLYARDRMVFDACRRAGVPVAWVLAGGYTEDISKVVAVHVGTARAALDVFGR